METTQNKPHHSTGKPYRRFKKQNPKAYESTVFLVRRTLDLSQAELAQRIEMCDDKQISRLEVNNTLPYHYRKRALFNELAAEAAELLGRRAAALTMKGEKEKADELRKQAAQLSEVCQ